MNKRINQNADSFSSILEKETMLRDSKRNSLKLCVIICTMDRHKSLDVTFHSISQSSIKPCRIIIIDDSKDDLTEKVVSEWQSLIPDVIFVYIISKSKIKSLTKARNIGINYIEDTDIVLFLDDDVTLDRKYMEEIVGTFRKDPQIVGVQGFIPSKHKNALIRLLLCSIGSILPPLVSASFFTPYVCATIEAKYPVFMPRKQKMKECQWLSGSNMAYRADIFKYEQFRFDENFISYCLAEDVEFSHRLFKNKKKLIINFDAKVVHRASQEFRQPRRDMLLMYFGYRKYLIHKFISRGSLGDICYYIYSYRSLFSVLIWSILYKRDIEHFREYSKAYQSTKILSSDIKNLNLNNLNKLIMSKSQ